MKKNKKPEWFDESRPEKFACSVMSGVKKVAVSKNKNIKRKTLSVDDFFDGILNKDRTVLAKAITLVESSNLKDNIKADKLIKKLLPYTGSSLRIGITGVPGAGKSTFIDTLGSILCSMDYKVAVLAVDPSSSISRGSILGDKTRMEKLLKFENSFIRPSPSSGTLGGVTKKTRETIMLCEAFGFNVILIETVGVGQSEITVRSMVDFFLLLLTSGAGDELQGIKKGIVELADAIVINKADGTNKKAAELSKTHYSSALKYLNVRNSFWACEAYTCSSLTGEGVKELWNLILNFEKIMKEEGSFLDNRKHQMLTWFNSLIEDAIKKSFMLKHKTLIKKLEAEILSSKITVSSAISKLLC